jgi:hypothetical protein
VVLHGVSDVVPLDAFAHGDECLDLGLLDWAAVGTVEPAEVEHVGEVPHDESHLVGIAVGQERQDSQDAVMDGGARAQADGVSKSRSRS